MNKELLRTIKFTLFSISAGIIQVVSFSILKFLIFENDGEYGPAYFIALTLSVLWNFTFNRKFTFKSANNIPKAMGQIALFYLIFTPITTIGGNYLVEQKSWPDFLVLGITMALNLTLEFIYCKYVVYKDSIDSAEK